MRLSLVTYVFIRSKVSVWSTASAVDSEVIMPDIAFTYAFPVSTDPTVADPVWNPDKKLFPNDMPELPIRVTVDEVLIWIVPDADKDIVDNPLKLIVESEITP